MFDEMLPRKNNENSFSMWWPQMKFSACIVGFILLILPMAAYCEDQHNSKSFDWNFGNASISNRSSTSHQTMGACGDGEIQQNTEYTGAVHTASNYATCGVCLEIRCATYEHCFLPAPISVKISGFLTDANPPLRHIVLEPPEYDASALWGSTFPVNYRRVSCKVSGGIRFTIKGRSYFNLVLISNVGGAGDVVAVSVKGTKTGWKTMSKEFGQLWKSNSFLDGQRLSFNITTSDGRSILSENVTPEGWSFGGTFVGGQFP